MDIRQFVHAHKIRADVAWTDSNPNWTGDKRWHDMARHFRITLKCRRRSMVVPFSQGPAIEKEPTVEDVLDCLASDASTLEGNGFEEWCRDLGYDTDSRSAEKAYRVIQRQAKALKHLLGNDQGTYDALIYQTDRL